MWIQHFALPVALLISISISISSSHPPEPTSSPAQIAPEPATGEDFATLSSEYEQAQAAHEAELRRLKGAERREFAKRGPAVEYWPRFQALADAGHGRALFWMASNVRARAASILEGHAEMRRLYGELVERHGAEDWFGAVVQQLPRERSQLGGEEVARLCRLVLEKNAVREIQAQAIDGLMGELRKQKTPGARSEANALMQRLVDEYADTEAGARAAKASRLAPGAIAPDFTGKTIDGYEFKLSDYRGKVVLVDFYGFW